MTFLAGIGAAISNNKQVQYLIGVATAIAIFYWWLTQNNEKVRKLHNAEMQRKSYKSLEKVKDRNAEKLKQTNLTRANFRSAPGLTFDELSDDTAARLTRGH